MYFLNQSKLQYQNICILYAHHPEAGGDISQERVSPEVQSSPEAEVLEDRASRVVEQTQAQIDDTDTRVARLREIQGPVSPAELDSAKAELGADASTEAIEQHAGVERMKDVAFNLYAEDIGMSSENLQNLYELSESELSGKTPAEIESELTTFANDMEKLQILVERNGLQMPTSPEEYAALMEQFRGEDGQIRIPITPEEAAAAGLVLNDDGTVNIPASPGYGAGGDAPRGRPYVGGNGQVYSGYEGGANRMDIDLENLTPGVDGLVELIYQAEAGGDPDIIYGGCPIQPPKPITQMTVAEVRRFQDQMVAAGSASSAVGGCQVIRSTLDGAIASGLLSSNELFNQEAQKRFTIGKMEERGLSRFQSGAIDEMAFMRNLSQEWASLPKDMSGASYYAGDGLNHALVSPEVLLGQLRTIRGEGAMA